MMRKLVNTSLFCFVALVLILISCTKETEPTYLFNGIDLAGWDSWLGLPFSVNEVPQLARAEGSIEEQIGLNSDSLGIFSVVQEDGEPAIRIDGYVWGALITQNEYENYHLHLEFKWGEEKHPPRENLVRNSGLCYHSVGEYGVFWTYWMRSFEIEIKEGELGDFVRVDSAIGTVPAIPNPNGSGQYYSSYGEPYVVEDAHYLVHASNNYEKPYGEWNSIDLYAYGNKSIHVINGAIVLRAENLRQSLNGEIVPLASGKIQLQSEGAEIFYRNIWIKSMER